MTLLDINAQVTIILPYFVQWGEGASEFNSGCGLGKVPVRGLAVVIASTVNVLLEWTSCTLVILPHVNARENIPSRTC